MRRSAPALCMAAAAVLLTPASASAHGVQGQVDTPVPLAAFIVAAGVVVAASFLGLGLLWSRPVLAGAAGRQRSYAVPGRRLLLPLGRAVVLLGLLLVLATAAWGSRELAENPSAVAVFVVWWVGLVPLTLLMGDVWRALHPVATVARALRFRADTGRYPQALGVVPAAALLAVWAWLELVYPTAASPRLLATLIGCYVLGTLLAMRVFGVQVWLRLGDPFTVLTRLLASMSPVRLSRGRLVLRAPVVSAARLRAEPGLIAYVAVLVGAVVFDGFSGTDVWARRDALASQRVEAWGLTPFAAGIVVATVGLLLVLVITGLLYEACCAAAARLAGLPEGRTTWRAGLGRYAPLFAHSLLPVAVGYQIAHYFTLFVFQSQDLVRLASDPFGRGTDLFGTADATIDFNVVSPGVIWTVQLLAVVLAHVVGLTLAHDRALETEKGNAVLRAQLPIVALMVALTVAGLWFLSEGMAQP